MSKLEIGLSTPSVFLWHTYQYTFSLKISKPYCNIKNSLVIFQNEHRTIHRKQYLLFEKINSTDLSILTN